MPMPMLTHVQGMQAECEPHDPSYLLQSSEC